MANVVKRSDPKIYRRSVHTPKFPAADWLHNPPSLGSLLGVVDSKYWKLNDADPAAATDIVEMSQSEKDAVDAAEATARRSRNRAEAIADADGESGEGVRLRAMLEVLAKRDNYLTARIAELQATLTAIKASSSGAQLRGAIPANFLPTATRTRAQTVAAFKDEVNSGNHDRSG